MQAKILLIALGFSNVRASTGRRLPMPIIRPTRGTSICGMAMCTSTLRLVPTMYGLFALDSRHKVSQCQRFKVSEWQSIRE